VDKNEAKKILLRASPWRTAREPEEKAAAEAAALDPELAAFQARQEEFNARVHQELAEIPVPPHLRDQILARRKIIRGVQWHPARWIAAVAASAALAAGIWFMVPRPTAEDLGFTGFRSRMIGFALREYRMDIFTSDFAQVKAYLASSKVPADFSLPQNLRQKPVKGGAALTWQGKPVAMVCFDSREHTTLYMFVVDNASAGFNAVPGFERFKDMPSATWTDGGKTFLLAGKVSDAELKELLPSPSA
jgi:hypothetical protein